MKTPPLWRCFLAFITAKRNDWLLGGIISAVLLLLVALPLVLSYETHAVLADLSTRTDTAMSMGGEIHDAFSRELSAIAGFQATGQSRYIDLYREQMQVIDKHLAELQGLTSPLGSAVENRFKDLQSAVADWHLDTETERLARGKLQPDEFRELMFNRMYVIRRAHEAMSRFNKAIVEYQAAERARVEKLAYLFTALTVLLAGVAVVGIVRASNALRAVSLTRLRTMQSEEQFWADTSAAMASSLDYKATLKVVARLAVPRVADCCAVHLVEEGHIVTAEIVHADPAKALIAQRLTQKYPRRADRNAGPDHVIRTGEPDFIPDIADQTLKDYSVDEEHLELLRRLDVRSAMIVPLSTNEETFGSLTFLAEAPRRFGADDLVFARNVARHAALAIRNSRLYSEAQEAIRARDEVLGVVSHDLRSPTTNILMTTKLLGIPSLPHEQLQGMVQIISRAAQRMSRLIEDLITVARIRGGQEISLNIHPENPAGIVDEICETFGFQARAKSIELECLKSHPAVTIKADRSRVLQVLSNLVDNAIKFTPEGGRILVTCEQAERAVRFSVKDTGRGIERKDLERIFDRFWQGKSTAHLGAGFGLAIAKTIVEQHGGRIWAESSPGLGTTFFFTLPLAGAGEKPLNLKAA
jgi:signal transduction histidine kinase